MMPQGTAYIRQMIRAEVHSLNSRSCSVQIYVLLGRLSPFCLLLQHILLFGVGQLLEHRVLVRIGSLQRLNRYNRMW